MCTPNSEAESPVLRNRVFPVTSSSSKKPSSLSSGTGSSLVGLGIGLMEPFSLPGEGRKAEDSQFSYPTLSKSESEGSSRQPSEMDSDEDDSPSHSPPPLKKRKIVDGL